MEKLLIYSSPQQHAGTFFASVLQFLAGDGISGMDHLPHSSDWLKLASGCFHNSRVC
jgi:hypothetical protein